jgi:hypothetical protein
MNERYTIDCDFIAQESADASRIDLEYRGMHLMSVGQLLQIFKSGNPEHDFNVAYGSVSGVNEGVSVTRNVENFFILFRAKPEERPALMPTLRY